MSVVMLYALLKCFFHLLYCLVSCAIVLTLRTTSNSTVSSSFNLTPLGFCGFPNWKEEEKKGVKKVNCEEKKQNFKLSLNTGERQRDLFDNP